MNEAYQGLLLQKRRVSIKHKNGSDAEEQQLTDAVEQGEEVGVLDAVAFTVPHPLHCLVQPYADVCSGRLRRLTGTQQPAMTRFP